MVRQARILAQATSDLVNAIKADAEGETDLENSRKLLSAAKILADATAKMVEAAKVWPLGGWSWALGCLVWWCPFGSMPTAGQSRK